MREKLTAAETAFHKDPLQVSMTALWLVTVFASFGGGYLFPITVPKIGTLFLFRMTLPITAGLYLAYALREKESFWPGASPLEKWTYVFIGVMLVYGAISLFWAINFDHSFRKLFNLCFDMGYFFLFLRLCKDEKMRKKTLWVCGVTLAVFLLLGLYEVFNGGIWDAAYNVEKRFEWGLASVYQAPLVTSGNTNDYASTVIFYGCAFFLLLSAKKREKLFWPWIFVPIFFPIAYLLNLAGGARFGLVCIKLLWIAVFLYVLVAMPRKIWIPLLAVLFMLGVDFMNQYRYIVPPVQTYLAERKEYREQQKQQPGEQPTEQPGKPSLIIETPKEIPLKEQFFAENEEDGKLTIQERGSAGVRLRLILHCVDCIRESHGLGVGIGNTEQLAEDRAVALKENGTPYNSIHCFIACVLADYGIFIFLPLCAIAWLLLKRLAQYGVQAVRCKHWQGLAYSMAFFVVLVIFPIMSTASSDAQDCLSMWAYLAMMVQLNLSLPVEAKEKEQLHA